MWSPNGLHLKKTSTYNSVQNPYGLHMDSYGLHLDSTRNPSGLQMDQVRGEKYCQVLRTPEDWHLTIKNL
jgi:hypothetical protein